MHHKHGLIIPIICSILILGVISGCKLSSEQSTYESQITPSQWTVSHTQAVRINTPQSDHEIPSQTPLTYETRTIIPTQTTNKLTKDEKAVYYKTIAIAALGGYKIIVFQPDGNRQQSIHLDDTNLTPIRIEQITNGCDLIVIANTINEGHKLLQMDLNGEIQKEIYFLSIEPTDVVLKYLPSLSPNGKHISYVVFSGELYYDSAQYQDIAIVSVDAIDQPIPLSLHGGTWDMGGAWSPDGDHIAYTDFDNQGALQVYITDTRDMTQQLVAQFDDLELIPGPISWSPTGNLLAVSFMDKQAKSEVWIIPLQEKRAFKLNIPEGNLTIGARIFWSEDSTRLLLAIWDYSDSSISGLYWFDVNKNILLHVLREEFARQIYPSANSIANPFPIMTDLSVIVFSNSETWYSYNATTGQFEHFPWINRSDVGIHYYISIFRDDIFMCDDN